MESAVDELAHFADEDPLNYRLNLLSGNERCSKILEDLSRQSGWTSKLDNGFGRGVAIYEFMVKKFLVGKHPVPSQQSWNAYNGSCRFSDSISNKERSA